MQRGLNTRYPSSMCSAYFWDTTAGVLPLWQLLFRYSLLLRHSSIFILASLSSVVDYFEGLLGCSTDIHKLYGTVFSVLACDTRSGRTAHFYR
ncbi:hypothetical protein Q1695_011349 [Nippostrongylus brasiliensis]|nr:hypothetical protein Q1695_011349 [Nippostrongylus brasiliensis]